MVKAYRGAAVVSLSVWIVSEFTSPEMLLLMVGLTAEAIRQIRLSGGDS